MNSAQRLLLAALFVHMHGGLSGSTLPVYANPEAVTINGYSGPKEDAFITPDNQYLFFDSHNDASLPINLYWATRIDYKTFNLGGQIAGLGCSQGPLRANYAIPSEFYFFCLGFASSGNTVASGQFSAGTVSGVASIIGITLPPPVSPATGRVMLDGNITSDGSTLYFTDWQIENDGTPTSGQIKVAAKNVDGSFTILSNSDVLLASVNAMGAIIYGSVPSSNNLFLYFTVSNPSIPSLEIYVAARTSTSDSFGAPTSVAAANVDLGAGIFVETGSTSADLNYLYFHRLLSSSTSQIYVLSRVQ